MAIIRGNDSPNALTGTALDDTIFGYGGEDTINGGLGNDRILAAAGQDFVNGGGGDDIIEFRNSLDGGWNETINGSAGFDTLLLSSAGSVAGAGPIHFEFQHTIISSIERLQLNSGWNDITASFHLNFQNQIQFSPRLEFVGGAGKDTVNFYLEDGANLDLSRASFTNWSADDGVVIDCGLAILCTVNGTAQNDEILTGLGYNLLKGNGGDDLFVVNNSVGLMTIDGGSGRDSVVLRGEGDLAGPNLFIGIEEIRFESTSSPWFNRSIVSLWSDNFAAGLVSPALHFVDADAFQDAVQIFMDDTDSHFSAAGFTFENWGAGNRVVVLGSANNDRIIGSSVNDYIYGSAGADALTGESGNDTFGFFDHSHSGVGLGNRDRILDFGEGDKIDLSNLDASASLAGDQAFAIDTDGVLGEGEIRLIGVLNTIVQLNLDADADADMEITLLGIASASLSADDFIL